MSALSTVGRGIPTQPFLIQPWRRNQSSRALAILAGTVAIPESLTLADRIERMGRALNAKELARLLNVSEVTVFKQAKAGRIPSFRIGTSVRFDPKVLANWLRRI